MFIKIYYLEYYVIELSIMGLIIYLDGYYNYFFFINIVYEYILLVYCISV